MNYTDFNKTINSTTRTVNLNLGTIDSRMRSRRVKSSCKSNLNKTVRHKPNSMNDFNGDNVIIFMGNTINI